MSTSDLQCPGYASRVTAVIWGATVAMVLAACGGTRGPILPAPTPEATHPWMRALESVDSTERHAAARSLWLQASAASLPAESLMTVLNSDSGVVRLYVALTLLRSQHAGARWPAIEALDLHRSVWASGLLWRAAGERETFLAAFDDADPEVRYQAALALRLMGIDASAAADQLIAALADPEPKVAAQASRTLIATGPLPSARIPDLVAMLQKRGVASRLAAYVLGTLGPAAEPAIPALVALAKHGDPTSMPRSSGAMRLAAVRALLGIGAAARPYLDSLKYHPDPVLREVAQQALELMASNSQRHSFYPQVAGWVAEAYEADLKADLGNLVWAQTRYRAQYGEYAQDFPSLLFVSTTGVSIMMTTSQVGWYATALHPATSTSCTIFVGQVPPPVPGMRPNEPSCSP